jgi:hypothetical protein
MKRAVVLSWVALGTVAFMSASGAQPASAKKWTISQRQVALRKEVDSGLKANELTLKEAQGLRDRLDSVTDDETKMKAKNAGQLSYKDQGKLEKKLNSISLDMQKDKLNKRVVVK